MEYKNTYGWIQSYTTSAHTLRYQACDPKLEEDVKPVSFPDARFGGKSVRFHGSDQSLIAVDQSQTSENNGVVQHHHLSVSHTHAYRPEQYVAPFAPPRMMVWPADGVATSERHTEASAHAHARPHHSHQHAAFHMQHTSGTDEV